MARDVIYASFGQTAKIVALDGPGYLELLRSAPESGVRGGQIYDAIVVACTRCAP